MTFLPFSLDKCGPHCKKNRIVLTELGYLSYN